MSERRPEAPGDDDASTSQASGAASEPEAEVARPGSSADLLRTRTSAAWVGLVLAVLVVVAVLIFILQNNQEVRIQWLGLHVRLSLAVALLMATVAGALIPLLAGGARIVQLRVARRRAKREEL